MTESDSPTDFRASPGYALGRLARALRTSDTHEDAETRARAADRARTWLSVLEGMIAGALDVGSRTPVAGVPAWATLEVVTGGFATGRLTAEGPLRPHELAALAELPGVSAENARAALNAACLTDAGLARLQERLRSGRYELDAPEEGALLVVAWLLERDRVAEAWAVLDEIGPWFARLRFYPRPTDAPRPSGPLVHLEDVADVARRLERVRPNPQVLAQREAVTIWTPLYDAMIALFLETLDGDPPTLSTPPVETAENDSPARAPRVVGGWPCQRFAADWPDRARTLLNELNHARERHRLCGKFDRAKSSFAKLRARLQNFADDPTPRRDRDAAEVRLILAGYVTKRGTPASTTARARRDRQHAHASAPTVQELSRVVLARLDAYPRESGLTDPSETTIPITDDEAARFEIRPGASIPETLRRKVERALVDTVETLVERGIVTSGETLARVLPQLTSGLRAASIEDESLRSLYAAIYRAFRRRRSLLLLNLESQVRLEELPWVRAIDAFRRDDLSAAELSRQALRELASLALVAFPQAIVPNKLLQELVALAKSAKLSLPLTEELAVDIFMGEFGPKFLAAAAQAAELLDGSLYARYYAIDYDEIRTLAAKQGDFARLCAERAGTRLWTWRPAANGTIVEQQQIVTTHNLAVLYAGLRLDDALRDRLPGMARRAFDWICDRLQIPVDHWHAKLSAVKNAAYAWRQTIFYLSLVPEAEVARFLDAADEHLQRQSPDFRERFAPALRGLRLAAEGRSLDDDFARSVNARRFLGWSVERHWFLNEPTRENR